jgi:transposase
MTKKRLNDPKRATLREQGALNPHPDAVTERLFQDNGFFDPSDMVQVKYEMLRQVAVDDKPVTQAAARFGLSRVAFYMARRAFAQSGLLGLLPKKRGPRKASKLTDKVMSFLNAALRQDATLNAAELATRLQERFDFTVHPRSIEKALKRQKKKR